MYAWCVAVKERDQVASVGEIVQVGNDLRQGAGIQSMAGRKLVGDRCGRSGR